MGKMAPYFGMMELEDIALAGYRRGFQAAVHLKFRQDSGNMVIYSLG